MSTRLSKEDWDILDDILGKHGFGGYYDLVESLKGVLVKVARLADPSFCADDIKDLPSVVSALIAAADSAYADMVDAEFKEPDCPCPECGAEIPEDRETCPNCGYHEFVG